MTIILLRLLDDDGISHDYVNIYGELDFTDSVIAIVNLFLKTFGNRFKFSIVTSLSHMN